jgi:predicted ribosome quality control (RQC) complex YloA/Tae2 family protein
MKIISNIQDNINITYTIGNNAYENTEIVKNACPTSIWFHINDAASCHVVMDIKHTEKPSRKIMHKLIKQGALYCKQYTNKYKSIKNVEVIYNYIQNIQTTENAGTVITDISTNKFITI